MFARLLFSLFALAFAHDGGHGKPIEGVGPGGGALAAVVRAKDADKGEKARTIAIAEWKRSGNSLAVTLLDLQKEPRVIKDTGSIKWILPRAGGAKPTVLVTRELEHNFSSLEGVKSVEVILPAGYFTEEKSVAAFTLN